MNLLKKMSILPVKLDF